MYRAAAGRIREGLSVVIFPEGRLTETGGLMKVYDGPGMVADKADAALQNFIVAVRRSARNDGWTTVAAKSFFVS